MILLWLLCAGVTGQEPCSSPGDFPSPTLSLSTSSAQVGDSVLAQCSLRPNSLAALVIFCQDGKEISSQLTTPGQSLYQYKISVRSSGQFRCMYQYRINQNHVNNSRLSLPRTLNVTDRSVHSGDADHSNSGSSEKKSIPDGGRLGPEAIWGIAGLSVLCLAPLIYLLVKKVNSSQTAALRTHPRRSRSSLPRVQENKTSTYAIVGKVHGSPS
ncbi:uncharacterized protein LOC117870359 isoform X2 [Trachemys scripta elegans]|uniref:uncharacterized protein LOC117870359 isoform X2 n=1 Tax=Trachemys scripta elegans TaxID=31138 RepID=UPI0015569F38|nr:uncharacterized protein LOC117870359 isoform X2 [Trachemys scripta elegans]